MGWLSERARKLLLSMPAWRGMVTFMRSSAQLESAQPQHEQFDDEAIGNITAEG